MPNQPEMEESKNSWKAEATDFAGKVYFLCAKIPSGKISTYRHIADQLGTKSYRAVGQALRCNPYAPHVPCHRVISSNGTLGGFKGKTAGREIQEKRKLLEQEGIRIVEGKVDVKKYVFKF